jgi:hypothetical protein
VGALKKTLLVLGVLCLLGVIGMALPVPAIAKLVETFGRGRSLLMTPAFLYTVRVMCGTFVAIGIFLLILAGDPLRYGPLVPFTGAATVWVGVCCALFGMATGLPALYFVGDAAGGVLFGILILRFHRQAVAEAEGGGARESEAASEETQDAG